MHIVGQVQVGGLQGGEFAFRFAGEEVIHHHAREVRAALDEIDDVVALGGVSCAGCADDGPNDFPKRVEG